MKRYTFLSFRLLIPLLIGIFIGCEEDSTFQIEESQQIIFHYSWENHVNGYQFAGWCIDKDGVVWDLEEPLHWTDEVLNILEDGSTVYLYEKDPLEQLYMTKKGMALGKIRDAEMEKKIEWIEEIIYESYLLADSISADEGNAIYGFLSYDGQTGKYRRVILELSGDWYSALEDESAEELTLWLRTIQKDIGYPDFK
jgi:hypothetical protein